MIEITGRFTNVVSFTKRRRLRETRINKGREKIKGKLQVKREREESLGSHGRKEKQIDEEEEEKKK